MLVSAFLHRTPRPAWARLCLYPQLSMRRALPVLLGAQRAFIVSSRCADQGLAPSIPTVTMPSTEAPSPLLEQKTTSSLDRTAFPEFVVGANLTFDLAIASTITRVQATILHVYHPFTMSPVLRVRVVQARGADLSSEVILKLYDRRCLNSLREDYTPPAMWTPEKDREYDQWVQDLADGKVQPTDVDDEDFWEYNLSGGRLEDYLQCQATEMYDQELAAYSALAEFQGNLIPRLYGTVTYRDPSPSPRTVPGILIEYIPGLTMRELIVTWTSRTPRRPDAELASACEAAVAVVKRLAHTDVLNRDVRIDNLMFRDDEDTGSRSPVVLIDLALCKLRGSLTDEEWTMRKEGVDELGAAGQILNQNVNEHVGRDVWNYYSGGHRWTLNS